MKNIKLYLLVFLLLMLGTQAQAQVPQSHMRMHQQAMYTSNLHRQMHQQMHHMMGNMKKTSGKYKFNFVMLNGDTVFNNKKTKIHFREPIRDIEIKNKKEKQLYTPINTQSIFVRNGKNLLVGIPYKDHWIFETQSTDSIKFYAPFPETGVEYISSYQILGDTVKEFSVEGLIKIVKDNPKALKDAKKNKRTNALLHYFRGLKK